jgi:hypothetical protein
MTTSAIEKYAGKSFEWGGKTYILAPIGLGYMERVQKLLTDMDSMSADDRLKAMKAIIYRSLQRNYPDLTEQFIDDEILDLSNMPMVWKLALESSGLVAASVKLQAEAPPISPS